MKLIFVSMIFLSLILGGCGSEQVDPREREIIVFLNEQNYEGAIQKAKELYKEDELDEILNWIEEDKEFYIKLKEQDKEFQEYVVSPSEKLIIQDGWQFTVEGDYNYIRGRVKNNITTNITYFKLVAEYLDDSGNVLDSEYTNSTNTILPGNMEEFEIMKKHNDQYKQVRIFIEEIKIK